MLEEAHPPKREPKKNVLLTDINLLMTALSILSIN